MTSDDERRRRKKGHKSSSRGESGGRRHRQRDDDDEGQQHKKEDDHKRMKRKRSKLTEEEERLYAKAQEFVLEQEKEKTKKKHSSKSRRDKKDIIKRRRHRSESYDDSISSDYGDTRKRSSNSRKDHKKHSKKDDRRTKKKSKHGHRDDEEKHHKKKHKPTSSFKDKATKNNNIDTSNLVSLGDIVSQPPNAKLDSESNYFSHNSHLRLYLFRKYGIYFEDLTSSESHDAFHEFINEYNDGKLERAYYHTTGLLPQEAMDQCSRTKHQWKFKTNKLEERSLEMVREGVKKQTEYNNSTSAALGTKKGDDANTASAMMQHQQKGGVTIGPTARPHVEQRREVATPAEIAAQRQSDKRHRDRIKLANEEMYGTSKGDPGSHERRQMKKREVSAKLHGAARDRETEALGELNDDAIYGAGGDISGGRGGNKRGEQTYEEALAREKQHRERKENEKAARTSELLKKEEEKKQKMFEMLGLMPGERIKIAPRND